MSHLLDGWVKLHVDCFAFLQSRNECASDWRRCEDDLLSCLFDSYFEQLFRLRYDDLLRVLVEELIFSGIFCQLDILLLRGVI